MNSMQAREEMPIHPFPLQIFRFQVLYSPCLTGRLIWQSCSRTFRKIGSLYAPLKPTYPLEKKNLSFWDGIFCAAYVGLAGVFFLSLFSSAPVC